MSQQFSTYYSSAYRTDTYFLDRHNGSGDEAEDSRRCVPYDLISFLALTTQRGIDIYQITWDGSSSALGIGGTAIVCPAMPGAVDEGGMAFKRMNMNIEETDANVPRNDLSADARVFKALTSEVSILTHPAIRTHPNIIDLEAICFETDFSWPIPKILPVLMFQRAPHGDLETFVEGQSYLEFDTALRLLSDILQTVAYLHSNHLIHGDLKPKNILVFDDEKGVAFPKLADFGFSLQETDTAIRLPVSQGWNAPEVTHLHPDMSFEEAQKADIFSLGLLTLWLLRHVGHCNKPQTPPHQSDAAPEKLRDSGGGKRGWYATATEVQLHGPGAFAISLILKSVAHMTTETRLRAMKEYLTSALVVNSNYRAQDCSELLRILDLPTQDSLLTGKEAIIHNVAPALCGAFRIAPLMAMISDLDYRIRSRVVELLRRLVRNQSACIDCSQNAALQLAACVKIGFGTRVDEEECQRLLEYSGRASTELDLLLRNVEGIDGHNITNHRVLQLVSAGYFCSNDVYGSTKRIGDWESSIDLLEQECSSVGTFLGPYHTVTWELTTSLATIYQRREYYEKGAALCQKTIAHYDQRIATGTDGEIAVARVRRASMRSILAAAHLGTSKFSEAVEAAEEGIAEYESVMGNGDHDMDNAKRLVALCLAELGSYDKAITIVETLLEAQLRSFDLEHWGVRATREALANILTEHKQFSRAEQLLIQLLDGANEMTADLAETKHRLGIVYWWQDNFAASLAQLEEVKRFWESYGSHLGIVAPEYAPLLLDLIDTLHSMDRFEDALPVALQAIRLSSTLSEQTQVRALSALVDTRCHLQDFNGLENMVLEVYDKRMKLYGPEHHLTLLGRKKQAMVYHEQGRNDKAEAILREVVAGWEAGGLHLTKSVQYYHLLWDLADTIGKQKKWAEAVIWFSKVVDLSLQVNGKDHPEYWFDSECLAEMRYKGGGWSKRLALRLKALDSARSMFGSESVQSVDMMVEVANAFFNLGKFKAGEDLYQEIVPIQVKIGGHRTAKTIRCRTNLAFSMGMVGFITNDTQKRKEALKLEEEVYATAVELLGPTHKETQHVCGNLMLSYNMLGRERDALRMQSFYDNPVVSKKEPGNVDMSGVDSDGDWETDSEDEG